MTEEDYEKTKEQVESILKMFKTFVKDNRPQLAANMDDKLATGEVWFGTDALELGLCDEIKTADQVMTDYVDSGWDVYELDYVPPSSMKRKLDRVFTGESGAAGESMEMNGENGHFLERVVRWVIRLVADELKKQVSRDTERHLNQESQNYSVANSRPTRDRTCAADYDGVNRIRT